MEISSIFVAFLENLNFNDMFLFFDRGLNVMKYSRNTWLSLTKCKHVVPYLVCLDFSHSTKLQREEDFLHNDGVKIFIGFAFQFLHPYNLTIHLKALLRNFYLTHIFEFWCHKKMVNLDYDF